jgi:hypothetical protein
MTNQALGRLCVVMWKDEAAGGHTLCSELLGQSRSSVLYVPSPCVFIDWPGLHDDFFNVRTTVVRRPLCPPGPRGAYTG